MHLSRIHQNIPPQLLTLALCAVADAKEECDNDGEDVLGAVTKGAEVVDREFEGLSKARATVDLNNGLVDEGDGGVVEEDLDGEGGFGGGGGVGRDVEGEEGTNLGEGGEGCRSRM